MPAETARQFEALEAQAQRLMGVFMGHGFEAVAPAAIQPAGVFLDCVGEALRSRTYVFQDPDGVEWCLRPDLTVPVCRLHLERDPDGATPAQYCYNGAAFRYQPKGAAAMHPREFRQAGIECIGNTGLSDEAADAQALGVMLAALAAGGLNPKSARVKVGDLGLVRAVFDAVEMPVRWRQRLQALFWRPQAFRAELKRLTHEPGSGAAGLPSKLVDALSGADASEAELLVSAYLDELRLESFGARRVSEVATRLHQLALDARAKPLSRVGADFIESYVAIAAPLSEVPGQIESLARAAKMDLRLPLERLHARHAALAAWGVDLTRARYAGEFGRALEYYTGFVFEIGVEGLPESSPVAGGGRYDSLMRASGCARDVPAVGGAIHTERLLGVAGVRRS
jgi:ATP phosphoribosyltransferase regulatory subunit